MRVEIPATRSKGSCLGDSPRSTLPRNLTAVGLFCNCGQYAFLSIARLIRLISQYVVFIHPRYYSSIPIHTFFHAPRCRRGSCRSVPTTSPWFPVHWRYTHRPCCPRLDSSWFMFAWIPRFFHATMLLPTPRLRPRQRRNIYHGNFRTRIAIRPPQPCSCWPFMKSLHSPLLFHIDVPPRLPCPGCRC